MRRRIALALGFSLSLDGDDAAVPRLTIEAPPLSFAKVRNADPLVDEAYDLFLLPSELS